MSRPLRFAVLALLAGGFALAVHSDFPLCPMAGSFGIPCPGCGLTRATLALLHGQVGAALHFHPLVWLLSPLLAGFMGRGVIDLLGAPARPARAARPRFSSRATTVAALCIMLLTLGVWLARFAGYFGGPVEVTSMHDWLGSHALGR